MKLFIVSVFTIFLQFTVTLGCQCEKMTEVKETYNLQKHDEGDRVCLCCYTREDAKIFFRRERIKVCDVDEGGDVNNKCYKQGDGAGVFIVGEVNQDDAGNWTCGNDLSSSNVVEIKDSAKWTSKRTSLVSEKTIKDTRGTEASTRLIIWTAYTNRPTTHFRLPSGNIEDTIIHLFFISFVVILIILMLVVAVIVIWCIRVKDATKQDVTSNNETREQTSSYVSDVIEIDTSLGEVDMSYYTPLNHAPFSGKCIRRLSDIERAVTLCLREILRGGDLTNSQRPQAVLNDTEQADDLASIEMSESTPSAASGDTGNQGTSDNGGSYFSIKSSKSLSTAAVQNPYGPSKRRKQSHPTLISVDVYPVPKVRYNPTQCSEAGNTDDNTGITSPGTDNIVVPGDNRSAADLNSSDHDLSLPLETSKKDNSDYLTPVFEGDCADQPYSVQ